MKKQPNKFAYGAVLQIFQIGECLAGNFYDEYEPSSINWTVTIIAAIHAIPILIVATLNKSRIFIYLTAAAMAIVAVAIGGSRYALGDLIFVVLGTIAAISLQNEKTKTFEPVSKLIKKESNPNHDAMAQAIITLTPIVKKYIVGNLETWIKYGVVEQVTPRAVLIESLTNLILAPYKQYSKEDEVALAESCGISPTSIERWQDLLWPLLEETGMVPKGTAEKMQRIADQAYLEEHEKHAIHMCERLGLNNENGSHSKITRDEFIDEYMRQVKEKHEFSRSALKK